MLRLFWADANGYHIHPFRYKKNAELWIKQQNEKLGKEHYTLGFEDCKVTDFPEWSWYWSYKTEEIEYEAVFEGKIPEDD